MEKNRLKACLPNLNKDKNKADIIKYSGWYIIMMLVMVIPAFAFLLKIHSFNYREYCSYPKDGEFYHFIVEGEEHCLIDWFHFLIIPAIGTVMFLATFVLPVFIVRLILKYIWKTDK